MPQYILIPSLDKLKQDILTSKKELYAKLIEEAERCFCIPLSEIPPKQSTTFLSQAIMNLTLAYKLSGDNKYFNEALRFIKTVCAYPYWGNAHLVNVDLSASWILFGLSLAYNYLKDDLSSEDVIIIENKLLLQAKIMFDYINEHEDSWPKHYFQNHNWINFTGLATVGYALKDKYEEVKKYIEVSKQNFETVFSYLPEDGSDYEGVTYWRYGVLWLFIYADVLLDREHVNYFEKSSFLKNTFYYRLYQSASRIHTQLNFGDCHDRHSCNSMAMYYKIAAMYNNGHAQKLGNMMLNNYLYEEQQQSKIKPGILPEAWLSLLWYNPSIKEEEFETLNKVHFFEDLGLITLRTGFKKDDLVFSIKCSYPGGKKQWDISSNYLKETGKWIMSLSHHHPDNLSYIITKNEEYLAIDDGYNRNILPSDHNVLLVDNYYADVHDVNDVYIASIKKRLENDKNYALSKYKGEVKYFFTDQKKTLFKLENKEIYPLALKMQEVSRFVFSNNLDYILFIDQFESEEPHLYQSVLNADHPLKELAPLEFALSKKYAMRYKVLSLDALDSKESIREIKSVMTTQEPDQFCRINMHRLIVSTKEKVKKHRRIEFFFKDKQSLSLDKQILKINNNECLLLENTLGFEFDGEYLYIEKEKDIIKEIILIEGTYIKYNGKTLIKENQIGTYKKEV